MMAVVLGAVLVAVVVVLVVPALAWVGIGLAAAVGGQLLYRRAEATHAGSELIETNV